MSGHNRVFWKVAGLWATALVTSVPTTIGAAPPSATALALEPNVVLEVEPTVRRETTFALGACLDGSTTEATWLGLEVRPQGRDLKIRWVNGSGITSPVGRPLGFHHPLALALPRDAERLEVLNRDPGAYAVRCFSLPSDHPRARGDRLWTRAVERFERSDPDGRGATLELFLGAARAYEAAGLGPETAEALAAAGHQLSHLGKHSQAVETLTRAVALRRVSEASPALAESLHLLAQAHRRAGDVERASARLRESLALSEALDDLRGQARAWLNLGFMEHRAGRAGEAFDDYQKVLPLAESIGDRGLALKMQNNLAGLDLGAGRSRQALERLRGLQGQLQDPGTPEERRDVARTWINTAAASRSLGRFQDALDYYFRALDLLDSTDEPALRASTLNNLGFIYLALGDGRQAADYFDQSLDLRRRLSDRRGQATNLSNLGLAAMQRQDHEAAELYFQQALELHRELSSRRGEATVLHSLGRLRLAQNRWSDAEQSLEQAIVIRRDTGDTRLSHSLTHWVEARRNADPSVEKTHSLVKVMDEAVVSLATMGDVDGEARALRVRARLHRDAGRPQAADADLARAMELAESLRLEVHSPDLRAGLLAERRSIYEDRVNLLMAQGTEVHSRRAFAIAERARARSLLDALSESDAVDPTSADLPALRAAVEDLAAAEHALKLRRRRHAEIPPDLAAAHRQASIELDRRLQSTLPAPRRAVASPELLGADALQRILGEDPDTALLVFALGESRSFLWWLTGDRFGGRELPGRAELEAELLDLIDHYAVFDPRGRAARERRARELSQALLGPVADALAATGVERWMLVAEGALLGLPFAALPWPGDPSGALLVDRVELGHLPSVSLLPVLRRAAGRSGSVSAIGIVGDPVRVARPGAEATSALPYSRYEAERLAELAGDRARLWLGDDARRQELLTGSFEELAYLHFATHGLVHDQQPELSALLLSGAEGRSELRLHDIYRLDLSARLVVLSGCRTALGKPVAGEGFLSLARGFFFAGAARVAAGLWQVDDRATAELMVRFYDHMLRRGMAPTAALRQAQLDLRRETRYKDPFYWAGFQLQGDWRP